jgi:hypothetical protein
MSSVEEEKKRITRREFVKGAAAGAAAVAGAGVLASCGPTPEVITETVEVPVEVTTVVEKVVEVPPKKVTLEVLNPLGLLEVRQEAAPRLADLHGKTICEIWQTGMWIADETFPIVRELLQARFPDAKFIPYSDFPRGTTDEYVALVKAKGCDAVLVGNGG